MKVLTHDGALLTLHFTTGQIATDEFQRIDTAATTKVGVVGEMDERVVRHLVNGAAEQPGRFLTPREMLRDLQYIDRTLHDIPLGTEVKVQSTSTTTKLVIPPGARPEKEPLAPGDRIAVNHLVKPKAWMNCHGTVESVAGDKASVSLDHGDRERVARATSKRVADTVQIAVDLLDKLEPAK